MQGKVLKFPRAKQVPGTGNSVQRGGHQLGWRELRLERGWWARTKGLLCHGGEAGPYPPGKDTREPGKRTRPDCTLEEPPGEANRSDEYLDHASGNRQQGLSPGEFRSWLDTKWQLTRCEAHRRAQPWGPYSWRSWVVAILSCLDSGYITPTGVPLTLSRPPTPVLAQRDLTPQLSPPSSVSPMAFHHL